MYRKDQKCTVGT